MPKKTGAQNSSPGTGNGGVKRFLNALNPFKRTKSKTSSPVDPTARPSNQDPRDTRGFSLDSALAAAGGPAARPGRQAELTDTELANLERRRRRMSSQAQLEGLPNTAFSPSTTTGKGKAQASEETESINTTRKGYRSQELSDA